MPELTTRRGSAQWKAEYDHRGKMTSDWAEKFLLGMLIVRADEHAAAIGETDRELFRQDSHKAVIRAIRELHEEQTPIDLVSVAQRLSELSLLDELPNGVNYILELTDQAESYDNRHAHEWISTLRESRQRDEIRAKIEDLQKLIASGGQLASVRTTLENIASTINDKRSKRNITLSGAIEAKLESLVAGKKETSWSGIPEIVDAIGGVACGELLVMGARPGHGKTLVAGQWADECARDGISSIIVSEEMSASSIAGRALQRILPADAGRYEDQIDRIRFEVKEHFATRAPILIAESCGTVAVAERAIARAVDQHDIKLAIIDYAQLLRGDGHNQYERVSDVSTRMKRIAMKYEICVILLAQINRASELRPGAVPQLSDLKDSGQIEQDADVVLFLQWPARIDPTYERPNEYRIYQAKNRSRGIKRAVIEMRINAERQRLEGTEYVVNDQF